MMETSKALDVAVVGGGVAGLTAATQLARQGLKVALFDKAGHLGGRAITTVRQGFAFNLGPHALYRGGAARRIFDEMGLRFAGAPPATTGGYAIFDNQRHTLPAGFVSLLTTKLLRLPAKLEVAKLLGAIHKIDPAPLDGITVNAWLAQTIRHEDVRHLVRGLIRIATYANAADQQSAGHALRQVQMAFKDNVDYLDGGWQSIVDGLSAAAREAGVETLTSERIAGVAHDDQVQAVVTAAGTRYAARAVVLALPPADAAAAVSDSEILRRWDTESTPIRAACLDLGLSSVPDPHAYFALGINRPLYFSLHSAAAKLAPAGGGLLHVARYLDPAEKLDPRVVERELEAVVDLMQPGWRDKVVERQFLPNIMVYPHLVTAAEHGTIGRPSVQVPGISGLYVAGDWVGDEGLLVDASVASASVAAKLISGTAGLRRAA